MRAIAISFLTGLLCACGGSSSDNTTSQLGQQVDQIERQSDALSDAINSSLQSLEQDASAQAGPSSIVVDQVSGDYQAQLATHANLLKECDALRVRIEQQIADTPELNYSALEALETLSAEQVAACRELPALQPGLDQIAQLLNSLSGTLQALEQQVADAKALLTSLSGQAADITLIPGTMGPAGPQGPKGNLGSQGPKGATGEEGEHYTRDEVETMVSQLNNRWGDRDTGTLSEDEAKIAELEEKLTALIALAVSIKTYGEPWADQ